MDYKETVMSDEQIMELEPRFKKMDAFVCDGTDFDKVAEAQAKLTWEARQNEVDEAEQRGIEKVVDKINPQIEAFIQSPKMPDELALVIKVWWQAFLKEVEK